MLQRLFEILAWVVIGCPAILLLILGLPPLVGRQVQEQWIVRVTKIIICSGLLALAGIGIIELIPAGRDLPLAVQLGDWVSLSEAHFHFRLEFMFDRLSIPFAMLGYALCGLISAFAANYMHREPGFHRFFMLFAMFLLGLIYAALAGSIETLFFGWELVGLSSALLVAFFHDLPAPVRNGVRVWSVYRFSDAAFLIAAATLHHLSGEGEFQHLTGSGGWPMGQSDISTHNATIVGLLLVLAAAGKSALIPFSGWLPRAMEGPTPSSAIFYGALSIHLGAFLLLRIGPLLEASPALSYLVACLGLVTAVFAVISGRVQSDIKSALAFASLTQVGLIVAEIGLGFRYLPLAHIIGHACLRTLQLLRAPTLLKDYQVLENALGQRVSNISNLEQRILPLAFRRWVYRIGLERGYLDASLDSWIVRPFQSVFTWCDAAERRWTDYLTGQPSRESDRLKATSEVMEELL